jgi:hypothetical protein
VAALNRHAARPDLLDVDSRPQRKTARDGLGKRAARTVGNRTVDPALLAGNAALGIDYDNLAHDNTPGRST